jgi:biotin carboxyl carrier protein
MEMNTRVQVEHRVTELCYKLRFTNPDDESDYFDVESIIELMVLLAAHGKDLPKPERLPRQNVSVEARLNATNQALQPNAGGMIEHWSDAIKGEIRDDQGICLHNPDTDVFMKYHLAGAYDSNIALLVTTGSTREDSYRNLAEILRRTELRGQDLATNLEFHYGLVNWFLGQNCNARPTTRFVVPYLTAVGKLADFASRIDMQSCFNQVRASYISRSDPESRAQYTQVLDRKQALFLRPLQRLFSQPHLMAGWLSVNRDSFELKQNSIEWLRNPVILLADIYHFLNMDYVAGQPAAYMIWQDDDELLNTAQAFYRSLEEQLAPGSFPELDRILAGKAPDGFEADQWQAILASHLGMQAGTELMKVLPYIAQQTGFYDLRVNPDLGIHIPDELNDLVLQEAMAKVLSPPPLARSGEILAQSGGMFYSREAPEMDPYVTEGDHIDEGEPLYIVEVMKMFNKVYAPFSGTVAKVLIDSDGLIIKKGQPLFLINPDENSAGASAEELESDRRESTAAFLALMEVK